MGRRQIRLGEEVDPLGLHRVAGTEVDLPRQLFSSFSRDGLEAKSEKAKIAWPKSAQPKMLREPACLRARPQLIEQPSICARPSCVTGAAFDLGHQGLQLSLRMADGRLPDHPLRGELWNLLGCSSSVELKALVVSPAFRAAQFAALAPAVVSAAENGLKEARWIVDRSAAAQAEGIHAVAVVLGLSQPQVVGQGGAFEHLLPFRNAVREALSETLPEAQWCDPMGDACDGALNLARDLVIRPR